MKSSNNSPQPKLQPPGAGLPFVQRLFLKLWLGPIVSKRTPLTECRQTYERLTRKITEVATAVPVEFRDMKILVDPIRGLEDSSRYWSINNLLEHLVIVSKNVESVILALSSGVVPNGKADPAKVKPGKATHNQFEDFLAYAPDLLRRIDETLSNPKMNVESSLSFHHPWLGRMTAHQWYWLLSSHQGIHYQQIKAISRKIPKTH